MTARWTGPQPVLSDGVVTLRPLSPEDAEVITLACQDPDIQHYTQVPAPYSRSDADGWLATLPGAWDRGEGAVFAVTDARTEEFLGAIGLHEPSADGREVEVGYWTAAWARRRGATTRALRLVSRWALDEGGFQRLRLEAEQVNVGSNEVARSGGFAPMDGPLVQRELKGTMRRYLRYERLATAPTPPGLVAGSSPADSDTARR